MKNKYGNIVLSPQQRAAKRRAFNKKYYAQHRLRLIEYNKNWQKYNEYGKKYYALHKEENKQRAKEYYHRVLKLRKAARVLVTGRTLITRKDIVGNSQLRARIRHKYSLTKPQLAKVAVLARGISIKPGSQEYIKPAQNATPKKPWKRTSR